MDFFSKLFSRSSKDAGKSPSAGPKTILRSIDEKDISALQSDKIKVDQSGKGGTTLRKEVGPEISALEMAERRDWEVKTLPVYEPGDEIMDLYKVEDVRSGAMGHVYIATHKKWKRKLAIKAPNELILAERDFYARVIREAKSWTEMGLHPNIAYCYYVRNIDEVPHIVVEYVDGGNLRDWILDGKCLDYRTSLNLAIQFCHGLEYAHSKEMIHRDIKPENILMTRDGILKITDFGLVRIDEQKIDTGAQNLSSSADTSLTRYGDQMGTPDYMAPEQFDNPHGVDQRADIYAFGLCLYEMFCGNRPELGKDISPSDPATLRQDKSFPPALASVLEKSIQWDRDDRFDSCTKLRRELTRIYEELYNKDSSYAELELVGMEADGLNNQGVSHMELGNKEAAMSCWDKALKIVPDHLEATYNQGLIRIRREGALPTKLLQEWSIIGKNPAVNKERLAEYQAYIYAEIVNAEGAKKVLAAFPGKYEELFEEREVGSSSVLRGHNAFIHAVSLTPDGRLGLSGSYDNTVRLWDLETGDCLRNTAIHNKWGDEQRKLDLISLTPDGRLGLSYKSSSLFGDYTVRLCDLETGKCLCKMKGHTDSVTSVSLTPDGRLGLSGSEDNTVRLWDLTPHLWKTATGRCLRTMEGHTKWVTSVSLTPDGRLGLSGSADNTVCLWDLETGRCLCTMEGHTSGVTSVSLTPDGRLALSGGYDNTIRLWNNDTGKCLRTMEGHSEQVNSVSLTPDGRLGLSGSADETVRLWDLETGKCLRIMEGHTESVKSVSLTPDGRLGLSGGYDTKICSWKFGTFKADLQVCLPEGYAGRMEAEKELTEKINPAQELYNQKDYNRSWKMLHSVWQDISYGNNEIILKLYDKLFQKGKIKGLLLSTGILSLQGHTDYVYSVSLTPDGRLGLSGGYDNTIRLWDLETGKSLRTMKGHTKEVYSVGLTPDGRLGLSGSRDETARLWDLETGKCLRIMEGHTKEVYSVNLTPDGRLGLSGNSDNTVRLWDLGTGECLRTMKGHKEWVTSVSLTPDGRLGLSGSGDNTVRLWDLETGECLRTMEGHKDYVKSVSLTPDGRLGLSGSGSGGHNGKKDYTVRLWDLGTGKCLRVMREYEPSYPYPIDSVSLTPDGRLGLTGSGGTPTIGDKIVRLWDLETDRCLCTMEGHMGTVKSVSLTPDGRLGLSGSTDKTLRLWRFIYDLEFDEPKPKIDDTDI